MVDWSLQLRQFRRLHGLTQAALAQKVGVDQATISRWERGQQAPDLGTQRRLRDMIGVEAEVPTEVLLRYVRNSVHPVAMIDPEFRYLTASASYSEMLGHDGPTIEGMKWGARLSEDSRTAYDTALANGIFSGDVISLEVPTRFRNREGVETFAQKAWHPIRRTDAHPALLLEALPIRVDEYEARKAETEFHIRTLDEVSFDA